MFEKLYKEANDEIPVNTTLKEKLKKETLKDRKKIYPKSFYRYGYAAAAVVLVTVTASVLPKMIKQQEAAENVVNDIAQTPRIVSEIPQPSRLETPAPAIPGAADKTATAGMPQSEQSKVTTPLNQVIPSAGVTMPSSRVTVPSQAATQRAASRVTVPTAQTPKPQASRAETPKSETPKAAQTAEKEESKSASNTKSPVVAGSADMGNAMLGGYKGSCDGRITATSWMPDVLSPESGKGIRIIEDEPATAMFEPAEGSSGGFGIAELEELKEAEDIEEITLPEYLEEHGYSYDEERLPKGIVLTEEKMVYAVYAENAEDTEKTEAKEPEEDAEAIEDEKGLYCASYEGEEKSLSITFYPESEPIREMMGSMGEGEEVCIFVKTGENEYKAYFVKDEKGFIIESNGIENDEIIEFSNSLFETEETEENETVKEEKIVRKEEIFKEEEGE